MSGLQTISLDSFPQMEKVGLLRPRRHLTKQVAEEMAMAEKLGGRFGFKGTDLMVNRLGYGAMQLAGEDGDKHVWGPPKDRAGAVAVLRAAIEAGVNHIDTSDFYGPHVVNEIIREALAPYPADLVIVSKVGARRPEDGSWAPAQRPEQLVSGVEDNLRSLGLERIDVVNYRCMKKQGSIEPQVEALAKLKERGLIRAVGLSEVNAAQVKEAQKVTEIACVQNQYNLAHRGDDELIEELAEQEIAYVPYFPLGGFSPLQAAELNEVAAELGRTPMQVALAWLLHGTPNMLLIPGTKSVAHLRENLESAEVVLSAEALAKLDRIGAAS